LITEPNLAEIKPKGELTISSGTLAGVDLNYWSSLCADKIEGRDWKAGEWNTRIRITASVELDQRLDGNAARLYSKSPFNQSAVYDFSGEYFHNERDLSSSFTTGDLPVDERDDSRTFKAYLEKIRQTQQDSSISGQFVLDKLWFDFNLGDSITGIDGRGYVLKTQIGDETMAPEIVQIIYLVQKQQTKLITRDLRFSEKR